MSVVAKAGTFALGGSTGNKVVTGLGFQPKAILFVSSDLAAAGQAAGSLFGFGVAVSGTEQWCIGFYDVDADSSSAGTRSAHDGSCLRIRTSSELILLDFVSMDSDGFTVNSTVASSSIVGYLALGGSDLEANAGTFTVPQTGTSIAVTGVGFEPDAVLMGHIENSQPWPTAETTPIFGIGVMDAAEQAAYALSSLSALSVVDPNQYQRDDSVSLSPLQSNERMRLSRSSLDSDGFTLTISKNPPFHAAEHGYLALRGAEFKIGTETQKTSTGTKATTGVGFEPLALMLFGDMAAHSTGVQQGGQSSIGFSDGATDVQAAGTSVDAQTASRTARGFSTTKAVGYVDGTTPSVVSEAEVASLDSDGFTLDWTTADATAREFIYFAVGAPAAPSIAAGSISSPATVHGASLSPSGDAPVSPGTIDASTAVHGATLTAAGDAPVAAGKIAAPTTVRGSTIAATGDVPVTAGRISASTTVHGATVVPGPGSIAAGTITSTTTVRGAALSPGAANVTAGRIGPSTTVRGITLAATGDASLSVDRIGPSTTVPGAALVGSGNVAISAGTIGAATVVRGVTLTARTHFVGRFVMTTDAYGFDFALASDGFDVTLDPYGIDLAVEAD